jgi:pyruvate dehydrogenase E1 component alpha subunit
VSHTADSLPLALFRCALRIRVVEEAIAGRYGQQQMRCPVHLSIGQEGVAAGVCAALTDADWVFSNHRCHGHYLAKGGDLTAMAGELYGRVSGCCRGRGGSMHLVDPRVGFMGATAIVASTIPIAVGAALGFAMRGEARVSVSFLGDGATEEGVFAESLNFAATRRLPVVFVCENNLYSVYSPLAVRQPPGRSVARLAEAFGLAAEAGDGNDAEAVYELTRQAVERAKDGGGPTLLELATYRWREHCGPDYDNDLGYRDPAEFEAWRARCPVARLRARVLAGGAGTEADLDRLEAELRAEAEAALDAAEAAPEPDPATLRDFIYAAEELPPCRC